ncbi:MAG TPA: DUF393 domain-containing protein [Bacteroidia bacterium]|nr:DUF393 domain-containing protein [Bacteroidia bacterium]
MRPPEHPVILLDDECVLCHWLVRFIFRYDKKDTFRFTGLKSETGTSLCKLYQVSTEISETVILIKDQQYFIRSTAVVQILNELNSFRWLAKFIQLFPLSFRDRMYNIISKNRYRLFGKSRYCQLLPGLEKKFI